jgi:molecular chaperone DnaK
MGTTEQFIAVLKGQLVSKMGKIVGIDLGTTSSRIAVMQDGIPIIIENLEGEGTTPSYVAFTREGAVLVGEAARRQALTNHKNTIYAAKRLIGRRYDDPVIEPLKRLLPYNIVKSTNGDAWIEINGKHYSPVEISAIILKYLKSTAETFLGEPVTRAVITVPAYFDDAQRQATADAARIAGIDVPRMIGEPTSAAIAARLKVTKTQRVAVYDLGGGTFDISILEIGDGVYEVRSTSGDTFLGGEDFDIHLVEYLLDQFHEKHNLDIRNDKLALQRVKEAAEKAKIELSTSDSADINLPFLASDIFDNKHFKFTLNRQSIENLILPLVERTMELCRRALTDSGLTSSDIDAVILVGGSTRIPLVADSVSHLFGRRPVKGQRREDLVALGAAIRAGVLSGEVKDVLLLDVIPLSLGIETLSIDSIGTTNGGLFTRLIDRNTTIPTRKSLTFSTATDDQHTVTIRVYQGDQKFTLDNKLLGQFDLTDIPAAPRGVPQIEVTFDVDASGIIHVTARDKLTNNQQQIRVQPHGGLSEAEILDAIVNPAQSRAQGNVKNVHGGEHDNRRPRRRLRKRSPTPQALPPQKFFISYAHEDVIFAKRVEKTLSILEQHNLIKLWIDKTDIEIGSLWEKEIFGAIDAADAAILLVSEDFLVSKFIQKHELPRLFARHEKSGLRLLPIIIRSCPYTLSTDLAQFQFFNDPNRPWNGLKDWEVDQELTKLAHKVADWL